jgi:hypothetical protein
MVNRKFKGGYIYNNKALTYDLDHERQVSTL